MKFDLKYPIFEFFPNDNMVYVYYNDNEFKTTSTEVLKKLKFRNTLIVDSSGMKYTIQNTYITRYWGFWEGLFMKGKIVSIENEFNERTLISLEELKLLILDSYPKSIWFHSAWSDVKKLKDEMNKCITFEQLARIIGGLPPSKNIFLRLWRGY
jgi:hypothetical protein